MSEEIKLINFLIEKSKLPREKIIELISKKQEELGRLISLKTATLLVAKDLKIDLPGYIPLEELEKPPEQEKEPPELIENPFINAPISKDELLEFLNNIYKVAQEFIKQNFPNLDKMEHRITTIALMKLILKTLKEWK